MHPATPVDANRRTSSAVVTPPEAMTGTATADAMSAIACQVRARHHPVLGNVRVDNPRNRLLSQSPCQCRRLHLARLQPAVGRHAPVAGIDSHHEPVGKLPAHLPKPRRPLERLRPDHQPLQPQLQQVGDRRFVANPAAELTRNLDRSRIAAMAARLARLSVAGSIQVHQMQLPRPGVHPTARHRRRIVAEHRLLAVVPLPQANALAATQVNGRPNLHQEDALVFAAAGFTKTGNMPHEGPIGKAGAVGGGVRRGEQRRQTRLTGSGDSRKIQLSPLYFLPSPLSHAPQSISRYACVPQGVGKVVAAVGMLDRESTAATQQFVNRPGGGDTPIHACGLEVVVVQRRVDEYRPGGQCPEQFGEIERDPLELTAVIGQARHVADLAPALPEVPVTFGSGVVIEERVEPATGHHDRNARVERRPCKSRCGRPASGRWPRLRATYPLPGNDASRSTARILSQIAFIVPLT